MKRPFSSHRMSSSRYVNTPLGRLFTTALALYTSTVTSSVPAAGRYLYPWARVGHNHVPLVAPVPLIHRSSLSTALQFYCRIFRFSRIQHWPQPRSHCPSLPYNYRLRPIFSLYVGIVRSAFTPAPEKSTERQRQWDQWVFPCAIGSDPKHGWNCLTRLPFEAFHFSLTKEKRVYSRQKNRCQSTSAESNNAIRSVYTRLCQVNT